MTHTTIKLIALSLVQTSSFMTSHDVGITAVSARIFRVPFAQFLFVRVTKRMWWNFMWLYLIPSPSNDLMWPQWRHVMAIEVECLSRSKNRSVTGSLTVTQTSSIRIKTSLIESKHQKSSQNPLIGWNFDQWELGSSETLFTGSKIDEPRLFMRHSSWPHLTFCQVYWVRGLSFD